MNPYLKNQADNFYKRSLVCLGFEIKTKQKFQILCPIKFSARLWGREEAPISKRLCPEDLMENPSAGHRNRKAVRRRPIREC